VTADAWHTVSKLRRSRYRSRAEARVGRTEQLDKTHSTAQAAAWREMAPENLRTFGLAVAGRRLGLETADEDVDQVLAVRRLDAMLAQHAHQVLPWE
jgi:hypothetical protein